MPGINNRLFHSKFGPIKKMSDHEALNNIKNIVHNICHHSLNNTTSYTVILKGNKPHTKGQFIVDIRLHPQGDGVPIGLHSPTHRCRTNMTKKGFEMLDLQRDNIGKFTFWYINNGFEPVD